MRSTGNKIALGVVALAAFAAPAAAGEKWLKIMPDDPYSKDGSFHLFDIDSAFEDGATGFVAARMVFEKPDAAAGGPVKSWVVWAFDCKANNVYYVSRSADAGSKLAEDWREKPNALKKPVMGGVTNVFGKKLCALKGSWPKGQLP